MDVGEKDKLENRNEGSVSNHTPDLPCGIAEFANSSMDMVPDNNSLCSMVDAYVAPVWDHSDPHIVGLSTNVGLQEPNSLILPAVSIERAAQFSSFNSGSIADLMNTFAMNQTISPYDQVTPVFTDTPMFPMSSGELQKNEIVPLVKITSPIDEAKLANSDESDTGTKPCLSRKRKKRAQLNFRDTELSGGDATDNSKQRSKASDTLKEDYMHVRARRGQATNSHSLAERVRREKIRDRMKFLQDIVPGCSKVTGKAVMLDEIINYVQSLERQVEFLSMKLATVNPRMDCNIDGLLAKDQMFASRASLSSLGLSPVMRMAYPLMNPPQPSLPVIGSSSDALRKLDSPLNIINEEYKEPTQQVPNVWDDELQNVVQMGFSVLAPQFKIKRLHKPLYHLVI